MRQYDNEPAGLEALDRRLRSSSRNEKREAARRLWDGQDNKRTAGRLQEMLSELEREVTNLEVSIHSELELSRTRQQTCSAYLDSARMMQSRRQNLKATIADLTEKLAQLEHSTSVRVVA